MPFSGCSVLHGVNPNEKNKFSCQIYINEGYLKKTFLDILYNLTIVEF